MIWTPGVKTIVQDCLPLKKRLQEKLERIQRGYENPKLNSSESWTFCVQFLNGVWTFQMPFSVWFPEGHSKNSPVPKTNNLTYFSLFDYQISLVFGSPEY